MSACASSSSVEIGDHPGIYPLTFLTVLDIDPNAKTATVDAGSAEGLSPNDEYVAELSGKAAVIMKQPHVACRLTITSTDQHDPEHP